MTGPLARRISRLEATAPAPRRPAPPTPPDDPYWREFERRGLARWDAEAGGWLPLVDIQQHIRAFEDAYFDVMHRQPDYPWRDWRPPRKD